MIVGFGSMNNVFFKPGNLINIIRQMSVIGLIAIGVTIVIITTGIDLSSGSVLALAAVVAAGLRKIYNFSQQTLWIHSLCNVSDLPLVKCL